jgi:hypothetical protein
MLPSPLAAPPPGAPVAQWSRRFTRSGIDYSDSGLQKEGLSPLSALDHPRKEKKQKPEPKAKTKSAKQSVEAAPLGAAQPAAASSSGVMGGVPSPPSVTADAKRMRANREAAAASIGS